jgi:hypothetical protein
MDNFLINKILTKYHITSKYYLGAYPCDRLPELNKFPCSIVINTGNSQTKGVHWVAVFCNDHENVNYFDSLAMKPNQLINNFLNKFKNIQFNKVAVQPLFSISCGSYAICYIFFLSMGYSLKKFLTLFKSIKDNDIFVNSIVSSMLNGE